MEINVWKALAGVGSVIATLMAGTWAAAHTSYSNRIEALKSEHQQQLTYQKQDLEQKIAKLNTQLDQANADAQRAIAKCPEPVVDHDNTACQNELAQLRTENQSLTKSLAELKSAAQDPQEKPSVALPHRASIRGPGPSGMADAACGASISAISGQEVDPLSGWQELLKPNNEDCLWSGKGRKIVIDITPCDASTDGISSFKLRFSTLSETGGIYRGYYSQVALLAAGADMAYRDVFRREAIKDIEMSKEGAAIRGAKLLRLEISTHSEYKQKVCSIEVR